jgi:hypothetical protein
MMLAIHRFWRHTGKGPKYFSDSCHKVCWSCDDIEAWVNEQYNRDNRPYIRRHNSSRWNEPVPACELITGGRARTEIDLECTG